MNTAELPQPNPVFDAYLSALANSFHGEPWEAIEQYAHRIWIECRMDSDANWDTIRERARSAWPYDTSPEPPSQG